jgi:hypothetical protein
MEAETDGFNRSHFVVVTLAYEGIHFDGRQWYATASYY